MPQFDTFTFFSQLFWVLLIFISFYIALSYYLLPATAIVLKVRRRKLMSSPASSSDTSLALSGSTSSLLQDASSSSSLNNLHSLESSLSQPSLFESSKNFPVELSSVGISEIVVKSFTLNKTKNLLNFILWKIIAKSN